MQKKPIKINKTTTWQHNKKFTCNTSNIVYLIECKKEMCQKRYIGQTGRPLRSRLADHRGYVVNGHEGRLQDLSFGALDEMESSEAGETIGRLGGKSQEPLEILQRYPFLKEGNIQNGQKSYTQPSRL